MEWEKFVWTWGPAAPVILLLSKVLYDLVYRTIPRGFREIRRALESFEAAARDRHEEHMTSMRSLQVEMHAQAAVSKAARKPRPRSRRKRQAP